MTLLAGDILADAETLAYPFVSERALAAGPLLRQLSTLDAEVVGMIASMHPAYLAQEAASPIAMAASTNAAGYELEAGRAYLNFRLVDEDGFVTPTRIVPPQHLDSPPVHPAGVVGTGLDGQSEPVRFFYPCDYRSQRWSDGSDSGRSFFITGQTVTYQLIPEPGQLTSRTSVLVSPDFARNYLQWSLAAGIILNAHSDGVVVPAERLQAAMQAPIALQQSLWSTLAKLAPVTSSMRGY